MPDFLTKLIDDATKRINAGYYDIRESLEHEPISLKRMIKSAQNNAIIAEIKPVSPARGPLRPGIDPVEAAEKLAKGGAVGLSILTEPDNFGGKLDNLRRIRPIVNLPLLMKDIIVDKAQIYAGRKFGADCILLIESVFSRHHAVSLEDLIQEAHQSLLEVLLEVHNDAELDRALKRGADIIGLNNRNLVTLETDLNMTLHLLNKIDRQADQVVISESGFETANDIRKLKDTSVNGFLIGSSIMLSEDLETKVREFVLA